MTGNTPAKASVVDESTSVEDIIAAEETAAKAPAEKKLPEAISAETELVWVEALQNFSSPRVAMTLGERREVGDRFAKSLVKDKLCKFIPDPDKVGDTTELEAEVEKAGAEISDLKEKLSQAEAKAKEDAETISALEKELSALKASKSAAKSTTKTDKAD